jgi:hypothetical protein
MRTDKCRGGGDSGKLETRPLNCINRFRHVRLGTGVTERLLTLTECVVHGSMSHVYPCCEAFTGCHSSRKRAFTMLWM